MCWLTEYPVGKVSFLLFKHNTHFSCTPLKMFWGGQNIHLAPPNKMSSCAPGYGTLCMSLIITIRSHIVVQGISNPRKVNFGCVYSAYISKPVLSGRNLWTRIDASVLCLHYRPEIVHCSTYKRWVHLWNNFPCITSLSIISHSFKNM